MGLKIRTTYEQIIEWLETHDGNMPRGSIKINGRTLNKDEMTNEELIERNLCAKWFRSKEKSVLEACIRNTNR